MNSKLENYRKLLFIQMEYCEGLTLQHLLANFEISLSKDEKIKLIKQILEALSYIHEQNMIHRDLKPTNIFLDKNFIVKLGDFGLATTKEQKNNQDDFKSISREGLKDSFRTMSGGVGTPLYASPEQKKAGRYNEKVIFCIKIFLS